MCARYLAPCFTGLALQFFAPAVGNTVDVLAARCLPGGTSSPAGCAHPTAAGRARRGQAARPRCHQPVSGLHPRAARLEAGYEQGLPLAHPPPACTASANGAAPAGGASKEGRLGSVYGMLGEASRGNRLTHPTPPAACMAASSSASKENRPSNAAEAGSQAAPLPAPPATAHGRASQPGPRRAGCRRWRCSAERRRRRQARPVHAVLPHRLPAPARWWVCCPLQTWPAPPAVCTAAGHSKVRQHE